MAALNAAQTIEDQKEAVRQFWDDASCGEIYARGDGMRERLERQSQARYELEPFIFGFARFADGRGKDVLEIGTGMGADHLEWAKSKPRSLTGVDLTQRAIDFTRERLKLYGLNSELRVADAEQLPFSDDSFDIVYSWGVLHHSPNTAKAIREVQRVTRVGGRALVMVYHRQSLVGFMLWVRYGLLRGSPFRSLDSIYRQHLESPGTKAYSVEGARRLFTGFSKVTISIQLSPGDTLEGAAGQHHQGVAIELAKRVWPRRLIKTSFRKYGLFLLIEATK